MGTLILSLVGIIAVFLILVALKSKANGGGKQDEVWPYYARKTLTVPEQILYFRLVQALPEHIILAQVQLSRLLGVREDHNFHIWNNRINRMSVDFVVCNKDSSIAAVIELDDATHLRTARQVADGKKDRALTSAEVRIVHWQAKSIPDVATIRATFLPAS